MRGGKAASRAHLINYRKPSVRHKHHGAQPTKAGSRSGQERKLHKGQNLGRNFPELPGRQHIDGVHVHNVTVLPSRAGRRVFLSSPMQRG